MIDGGEQLDKASLPTKRALSYGEVSIEEWDVFHFLGI